MCFGSANFMLLRGEFSWTFYINFVHKAKKRTTGCVCMREDEQRRARKAAACAGVGATTICPSSVTLASRQSGGGRTFPGTDVLLRIPKDKC